MLLGYVIVAGLLMEVPRLPILNETIRAVSFHVPMWFGMCILFTASVVFSVKYLKNPLRKHDIYAIEFANTGMLLGILGILTGSLWARFTWGTFWTSDPKLNAAAIALLIYSAYFILRNSLTDEQQRARIGAIYNILAYATLIPLLFVLPRMTDSLHPGNGGNPGFNIYDAASHIRMVLYPAVIGWTLLGVWLTSLRIRLQHVKDTINERMEEAMFHANRRPAASDPSAVERSA